MQALLLSITTQQWLMVFIAYLIGAISFGIIASRLFNLPDPRTIGSGNIGATNVLRTGKKAAALFTLIGDIAKGWLPVFVANQLNAPLMVVLLVALAVFLGHLYPVYYRFKGGKGVATALGIMLALAPLLGLIVLITWGVVFKLFKYSSLSAIVAALLSPIYAWLLGLQHPYIMTIVVITVLLIWRHRSNIQKLLAGTEAGFGKKS